MKRARKRDNINTQSYFALRFLRKACPEPVEGVSPEGILAETEGRLEGVIAEEEAGENGFGYDPFFFVPGLNKTVAQLSREEKNAISHRGNAIRKLKLLLDELFKNA